jgi:hypothetical protein
VERTEDTDEDDLRNNRTVRFIYGVLYLKNRVFSHVYYGDTQSHRGLDEECLWKIMD